MSWRPDAVPSLLGFCLAMGSWGNGLPQNPGPQSPNEHGSQQQVGKRGLASPAIITAAPAPRLLDTLLPHTAGQTRSYHSGSSMVYAGGVEVLLPLYKLGSCHSQSHPVPRAISSPQGAPGPNLARTVSQLDTPPLKVITSLCSYTTCIVLRSISKHKTTAVPKSGKNISLGTRC